VLQRHDNETGLTLVLVVNGVTSQIPFKEESALAVFQTDMEDMLVHTGWTLQECEPERRRKRERRGFPRVTNDRRRWWTDPAAQLSVVPAGRTKRAGTRERTDKDRRS
jgi:hypothetical protein